MIDKQHYDFNHREPNVQVAMASLVNVWVNGGYEGGVPAAVFDFKGKLRQMGYGEQYIEDAAADCERIGNEGWKKKYGR